MDRPTSLYEPELVDRWSKRYRKFETEELVRRLRETQRKSLRKGKPDPHPDRPNDKAA
jgi:predicted DNA-binding protein (UPF0278 family)